MLYGLERHQSISPIARIKIEGLQVPVLSQPSRLGFRIRDGHLDLKENSGDTVAWKPTVGGEKVHANRPSSGNVATTTLGSDMLNQYSPAWRENKCKRT